MVDSPMPSPRVDALPPKSKLSASVFPQISGRESEFLDMDDEDEDEEDEQSEDGNAVNEDPGGDCCFFPFILHLTKYHLTTA